MLYKKVFSSFLNFFKKIDISWSGTDLPEYQIWPCDRAQCHTDDTCVIILSLWLHFLEYGRMIWMWERMINQLTKCIFWLEKQRTILYMHLVTWAYICVCLKCYWVNLSVMKIEICALSTFSFDLISLETIFIVILPFCVN